MKRGCFRCRLTYFWEDFVGVILANSSGTVRRAPKALR